MVNSESDFNENPMKKFTFRLTGVPPDQAIKSIDTEIARKTVKSLKMEVQTEYELNPILDIHLLLNGEVLSDSTPLSRLRLRSTDTISVMAEQAGSAPHGKKSMLINLIKEGYSEEQLIRKYYGMEDILKSDYQYHFGVDTFEEVQAEIVRPVLENALRKGYGEHKLYQIFRTEGYDFMLSSRIPGPESRSARLERVCRILYSNPSYFDIFMNKYIVHKLRITDPITGTSRIIRPSYNMMSRLNSLTPFKGDLNYKLDKVMAVFDIHRVVDEGNRHLLDYNTMWLEYGDHNYYDNIHGNGFLHFIANHFDEFKDWGIETPKQLLEFVIKTVSEGTAVEVDNPSFHRIAYKLRINGKIEYLVIGLDNDKSVHTLFRANPLRIQKYNNINVFNEYIITYQGEIY
ncbi:MAG: hypothetical protein ACXACY_29475, partial [Candidatus Hodarchaeales archaeon]|jgi:hypothetical protein